MPRIIDHNRDLVIRNIEALPRGLNCPFMLALESHIYGEYIAKRWLRKIPAKVAPGEVVIRF
jgi:tRNA(Glu) U13 pseudouridine synthase TruD